MNLEWCLSLAVAYLIGWTLRGVRGRRGPS